MYPYLIRLFLDIYLTNSLLSSAYIFCIFSTVSAELLTVMMDLILKKLFILIIVYPIKFNDFPKIKNIMIEIWI